MRARSQKSELVVYIVATLLTIAGTALCLIGLLWPNWYRTVLLEGIVDVGDAHLGLWRDEYCTRNTSCQSVWISDGNSSRPAYMKFPSWKLIREIETAGTAAAVLNLLCLVPFWAVFKSNRNSVRNTVYGVYFVTALVASFLCVIGCLVISSVGTSETESNVDKKINVDKKSHVDYAPFFSGIGGTAIFIAVGLACTICRYDPTYGTLENPVSPKFSRA